MELSMIVEHIFLVLASSIFIIVIGLALGIICYNNEKTARFIMLVVDILQTIPTLAMLGLIMVFFGSGYTTVILGMILYSLLPVVRNTYIGLHGINPSIREAAIAMGISEYERLFKVFLPIAFPMIFTGIRIAVVTSIGIAVFGTFVGGGGLGSIIYKGVRTQNLLLILQGTITLMVISIVIDFLMAKFEKKQLQRKGERR